MHAAACWAWTAQPGLHALALDVALQQGAAFQAGPDTQNPILTGVDIPIFLHALALDVALQQGAAFRASPDTQNPRLPG